MFHLIQEEIRGCQMTFSKSNHLQKDYIKKKSITKNRGDQTTTLSKGCKFKTW
jgi:hypothetical protein